ncbi:hypothetical protein CCB80_07005 [Armatimonadetes bacterium Uphvl-Ar1]|nr:hypothetical protein CCB80_07005 [Armatimonadetes bacterium Uphvl-Ar1]
MKKFLLLVVVGVVLVGCGPKNVVTLKRDAAPAVAQPGWYARNESGFSMMVPESYQVPRDPGLSMQDLGNLSSPAVSYGMTPGQESTTANATLILNDKNYRPLPGEPTTGLTVNIKKVGGGADLEGEAKRVSENLMNDDMTKVELPVGPGYQIKHHGKMVTGDEVWRLIYVVCDGETVYRVDFTTTHGADTIGNVGPGVMESFRVQ